MHAGAGKKNHTAYRRFFEIRNHTLVCFGLKLMTKVIRLANIGERQRVNAR